MITPTRPVPVRPAAGRGDVVVLLVLAAAGLALTMPSSAADGSGRQLDELVLGLLGLATAVLLTREVRRRVPGARAPWVVLTAGAAACAVAQLLTALTPGPALDGFGSDDVLLLTGGSTPLLAAALLSAQLTRTRWPALLVDGATVTVALVVVAGVVVEALDPAGPAADPGRVLLLAYGGYAALVVGGAAASLTVAAAASRRSAGALLAACLLLGVAAVAAAVEIARGGVWATGATDAAGVGALVCGLLAARCAPLQRPAPGSPEAVPVVSPAGTAVLCASLLALPVVVGTAQLAGQRLGPGPVAGLTVVAGLMAVRLVLRMREAGALTQDLVRRDLDVHDLVEHTGEGLLVLDGRLHVRETSPAARRLLGLPPGAVDAGPLTDLVLPTDRDDVRRSLQLAGAHPELVLRVVPHVGPVRELRALVHERSGGGLLLQLRDVTAEQRRQRELEQVAWTDALTGLPNAAALRRRAAEWSRSGGDRAVLVCDLDRFGEVDAALGSRAADRVLVEVGRRVVEVAGPDALVFRSGGDSFTALLPVSGPVALLVGDRLARSLRRPYAGLPDHLPRGGSVGVAPVLPGDHQAAADAARAAVRAAKAAGGGTARTA